jgi:prepilin-type N-terminal cleavage/methylation domain-containing protein
MNKKGLSLIEVMITMGVMSIVSLALGNMFMEQLKSNNFLEDQLSKNQVSNELKILTMNSEACKKTLSPSSPLPSLLPLGAVGSSQPLNIIRNNLGDEVLKKDMNYNQLTLKQMRLINESIDATSTSGTVRIEVSLERKRNGGPQNFKPITQSLYVTLDPFRRIAGCSNSAITPATVRTFSESNGTNPTARAECAADEIRLSCAGGRNPSLTDTCEEDNCGFIGVKPDGDRACISSVDDDIGTNVTVWITCFKYM